MPATRQSASGSATAMPLIAARSRQRILEIGPYPPPREGWGVRIEHLRCRLEAAGHTVAVLNTGVGRLVPSPEYETCLGAVDYVRKVIRYLRRGYRLHLHTNGKGPKGLLLCLFAAFCSRLFRRRADLTFHAGLEQRYFPRARAGILFGSLYQLLFRLCRHLICNSEAIKQEIVAFGVRAAKVHPIPAFSRQYVDFELVELEPALEAWLAGHHPVIFVYAKARLGFHLDALFEGVALTREVHPELGLLVVGLEPGHADASARKHLALVDGLDLARSLFTIESLSHDQFLTAMTASDLFLRTPPADGVCSSLLQARWLGLPVVAAENGARPAGVLTYPAADPEALARQVLRALEQPAPLPRMTIADTVADEVRLLVQEDTP